MYKEVNGVGLSRLCNQANSA